MFSSLLTVKATAAAALSAGVLLTGSIGAATAGALPAGAQDSASDLLSKVGVHVPTAAEASGEHADKQQPGDAEAGDPSKPNDKGGANHGQVVSGVAKSTTPGPEHGKTVSGVASGKNRADEHRADASTSQHNGFQQGKHQSSKPTGSGRADNPTDKVASDTRAKGQVAEANDGAASASGTTKAQASGGGQGNGGSANHP